MTVGSYSLLNLIQSEEFLLELSRSLRIQLEELKKARNEVHDEQKEAHKQGHLVKKMTNYMSDELARLEMSLDQNNSKPVTHNFEKLAEAEDKLRVLRGRLGEFIENDDESLISKNTNLEKDLHQYESFLLELTNLINSKIATLEKISSRLVAERRESQQQKILLREMSQLFSKEIEDLEQTFKDFKP